MIRRLIAGVVLGVIILLVLESLHTDSRDPILESPSMVMMQKSAVLTDLSGVPTIIIVMELANRGITSWGCPDVDFATGSWSPPDTGSPVVFYRINLEYFGRAHSDTFFIWPVPSWADSVRARVAGVDALDRQGPWSSWSLWYQLGGLE